MVGMDRADTLGLTQQEEKHFISTVEISDADHERLGLCDQPDDHPSAQSRLSPAKCLENPQRAHFLCPFNVEAAKRGQRSFEFGDGDDFFWTQIFLGSKLAVQACTEAQMAEGDAQTASIRSVSCLSSVDRYTPGELRAISRIESPDEDKVTPTPPTSLGSLPRSRASRLPVLESRLRKAANKKEGCTPRPHKDKDEDTTSLEPSPPPAVTPLAPTPTDNPQAKSQGTVSRANSLRGASQKAGSDCSPNTPALNRLFISAPLNKPAGSLSAVFSLLQSKEWEKKIEAFSAIQSLAQHHPEVLKSSLHRVCVAIIEEIKSLRSAVAVAAINTLADLYLRMKKTMDPEVDGTCDALLLRLKLTKMKSAYINEQVNEALTAMVQHCSQGRVLNALLKNRLSHSCNAVRASIAQHLHQLADGMEEDQIFSAPKTFRERFISAVCKASLDAAPEVRKHGQTVLRRLATYKGFRTFLTNIPDKDRIHLEKIMRKAK